MNTTQCKLIAAMLSCTSIYIAVSGTAQASLIDRGGGLIYDTDLDITWLMEDFSTGTIYDSADGSIDSHMTWQNAMDWAANLIYYDYYRNTIYDDWRLPTTLIPDVSCELTPSVNPHGLNCIGSELGHLFYEELSGVADRDIHMYGDNLDLVDGNIWSDSYWSATEYPYNSEYVAYSFDFIRGMQNLRSKDHTFRVVAILNGDVATVPIPTAAWLFGSGLLGMIGVARRKVA